MQNIEPDQVQLEHSAPQEPAPHTEPLQYAPVAASDHDRRFQKVRTTLARWFAGVRIIVMGDLLDCKTASACWCYLLLQAD